jgi:hypothetical protein
MNIVMLALTSRLASAFAAPAASNTEALEILEARLPWCCLEALRFLHLS